MWLIPRQVHLHHVVAVLVAMVHVNIDMRLHQQTKHIHRSSVLGARPPQGRPAIPIRVIYVETLAADYVLDN